MPVHVSLCVLLACFVDVHQIKVVEHYNWLLLCHLSNTGLAAEEQMQRSSGVFNK